MKKKEESKKKENSGSNKTRKVFFSILVGYKSGFKKAEKYPQFKSNAFDCKKNFRLNLRTTIFDTICGEILFYDIQKKFN